MEKIIAHEWTPEGFRFLLKWAASRSGKEYAPTWEPVGNVGEPLVDEYFHAIEQSEKKETTVDIAPLVDQARQKVKERLTTGNTKCRPRVYEVPLEGFTLKDARPRPP